MKLTGNTKGNSAALTKVMVCVLTIALLMPQVGSLGQRIFADETKQAPAEQQKTTVPDAEKDFSVTFKLPKESGYSFEGGKYEFSAKFPEGTMIPEAVIPDFKPYPAFKGWKDAKGVVLAASQIAGAKMTSDLVFTAVFAEPEPEPAAKQTKPKKQLRNGTDWTVNSAADKIASVSGNIRLVDPLGDATGNYASLAAAINYMDENASGGVWVLYVGSSQSTNGVDFSPIGGKVDTLVITGQDSDPAPDTPEPATTSPSGGVLTGSNNISFPCSIHLRNISYGAGEIYMNGNNLTLGHKAYASSGNHWYFGGSASGTLTANPTITVWSTRGSDYCNFVGGMKTGTLTGNTTINIKNTSGSAISIHGAGYGTGTGASEKANLIGNAATTISGMGSGSGFTYGLSLFVGGVQYGDITGTITNTISGVGQFSGNGDRGTDYKNDWGNPRYYGGSRNGDIGTDSFMPTYTSGDDGRPKVVKDTGETVITNNIDTSAWTKGRTRFSGTNSDGGTVKGNVVNTIKAGKHQKGGLSGFSGGAGRDARISSSNSWYSFSVNASSTDLTVGNIAPSFAAAEAAARYKHYGNITNEIKEGSICVADDTMSWFRGAGWGFEKGNVYSILGTTGTVYTSDNSNWSYSTSSVNKGRNTNFDMVGGGGDIERSDNFVIIGDTTLVTADVLARWTYGGSFGGSQWGDSLRIHTGGVVDTCEGSGYYSKMHIGNGRAEVAGGQVDWFLSGGGWNDLYQVGDVSVEVFDKPNTIINASMGGTFGDGSHYIKGNVDVKVHGGDFSGSARDNPSRGFSCGPSKSGYIFGDAVMTLDLRGNKNGFKLAKGDAVSGGRRLDASGDSYLGSDANNTITLNVFSDADTSIDLNGLNIYGDAAAGNTDRTRAGKITMNINSPGGSTGNIYATNYTNISSNKLKKDVTVNLVSAGSTGNITSCGPSDNINNTVAATTINKAVINVGPQPQPAGWNEKEDGVWPLGDWETYPTADGFPPKINVNGSGTTAGIRNFMSMNIVDRLLIAKSGSILNGGGATKANHYNTYQSFGDITLGDEAGLGVQETSSAFIAGALTVTGNGYVMSPGAKDQILFTDANFPNADSVIDWIKVGNTPAQTGLDTNYFGVKEGWPIIAFNPDKNVADKITPANFSGIEMDTGKTFIGDSDTHFTAAGGTGVASGYAVAIRGSKYVWRVSEGEGTISYHMDGNFVMGTERPKTGSLDVYGTTPMDTPTKSGSVAIPTDRINSGKVGMPKFTFTPDAPLGEWVKNLDVFRSDKPKTMADAPPYFHEGEQSLSDYQTQANRIRSWDAGSGSGNEEYSFDITSKYKNNVELTAKSIILTESEAQSLFGAGIPDADRIANIISKTGAKGRPFFKHDITDATLAKLAPPLADDEHYRHVAITYDAGTTAPNVQTKKVQVSIVPDSSIITNDKQAALVAESVVLPAPTAKAITAQYGATPVTANLDHFTDACVILAESGTMVPAVLANSAAKVNAVKTGNPGDKIQLAYSYEYSPSDGSAVQAVSKTVTATISGGKIEGTLFVDENGNGILDAHEDGRFAGKSVKLFKSDNTLYMHTFTDANGHYEFDIDGSKYIDAGRYIVLFPDLSNYGMTTADGTRQSFADIALDTAAVANKVVNGGYAWPEQSAIDELKDSFSKKIYDSKKDSNTDPYDVQSAYKGSPALPDEVADAAAGYVHERIVNDSTEELVYRLSFKIPQNTAGFGPLKVTDTMDPGLKYKNNSLKLCVDGTEIALAHGQTDISQDGLTVSYTINNAAALGGKTIDMYLTAVIEKVNGDYPTSVSNKGTIELNGPDVGGSELDPITDPIPENPSDLDPGEAEGPGVDNVGKISGIAFLENTPEKNGIYEENRDEPLDGITVTLLASDGKPVDGVSPVVTDENGSYEFNKLPAGTYGLQFSRPDGLIYTTYVNSDGKASGISISLGSAAQQTKRVNSGYFHGGPPVIAFTAIPLVIAQTDESHIMTQDELKAEMTVMDVPDGDLLAATVAKAADTGAAPAVDTAEAGVYPIEYTVTDSNGFTSSATRAVVINDGRYTIDEDEDVIIGARHFVVAREDVTGLEDQVRSLSHAEAYDLEGTSLAVTLHGGLPSGYTAKAPIGDYSFSWVADDRPQTKTIIGTVVDADEVYPGDKNSKYALTANGFTRNRVDAAELISSGKFVKAADAQVIKLIDSASDGEAVLLNASEYKAELGSYPIKFGIKADGKNLPVPPNSVTVNGVVSDGHPPTLVVSTPVEISVGSSFDSMDGVLATDDEDGIITSEVKVKSGSVDTSKVGIYHLEYSVTDSDHNTEEADRAVVVNDGSFEVGAQRILQGKSFVIRLPEVPTDTALLDAQILARTFARLYDGETGEDLGTSGIAVSDRNGYSKAKGEYPIVLSAADGNTGNDVVKNNVTAKVIDSEILGPDNPPLTGDVTYVYGNNLDLSISEAQAILSHANGKNAGIIEATESGATLAAASGTMTDVDVKITDDGGFKAKVGTYNVKVSDIGDKTEITLQLRVVAGESPVLTVTPKPLEIQISSGSGDLTKAQIMQGVTAKDKEDDAKGDPVQNKITYAIAGAASIPKDKAGVYKVTYSVTDSDGNTAQENRAIIVNDGSYIYDDEYILSACSFAIGAADVNKDDSTTQIKSLSLASAATVEGEPAEAIVTQTGGYTDTAADYTPVIGIVGYAPLTKQITAKVIDREIIEGPKAPVPGDGTKVRYLVAANNVELDYAVVKSENHSGNSAAVKAWLAEKADAVAYRLLATASAWDVDVKANGIPASVQPDATYKVTFVPKGVEGIEVTVDFHTSNDTPPVITFTKMPLVIERTDASHIMTQAELKAEMTVIDVPDGDLLDITVASDAKTGGAPAVDTAETGVYPIEYTVTDSSGNTVSAKRAVVVDDGRYVIDEKDDVIIGARDFAVKKDDVTGQEDQVRTLSYAEAYSLDGTSLDVSLDGGLPSGYVAKAPEGDYDFVWAADGRSITKQIKGTVVDADELYPGGKDAKYALAANSFLRNTADAAGISTDSDFIAAANARTIKLEASAPDAEPWLISNGGFKAEIGSYPIEFGIRTGGRNLPAPPNSVQVTGTVSDGTPPTLIVPTPTEINVGDSFNPMDGVMATDVEDGVITNKVIVKSGSVETDKVGIYHLVYEVTDNDHNTVTADRAVVVNDGSFELGTQRILRGTSFVIRLHKVAPQDAADAQILARTGARVYDAFTGADLGMSGITVSNNGGYSKAVGTYSIELTVPDGNAGNNVIKNNVKAKVIDNEILGPTNPPQYGDVTYVYGNNLDLTLSEADDILAHAGGKDAGIIAATESGATLATAAGAMTDVDVKVKSDGGFKAEIGSYLVKIADVNDKTEIILTLRVTAGEPPELTVTPVPLEIQVSPGAGNLTKVQIMQGVTATDKEDDGKGDPVQSKITYAIDGASSIPKDIAGAYKVTYSVTDSDGNTATKSRAVIVNDGSYVFDEDYVLSANSFVIGAAEVNTQEAADQIKALSAAAAMTSEGNPALAVVNEIGGYTNSAGDYMPVLGIDGYAPLTKQISAKVIDREITDGPKPPVPGDGTKVRYLVAANNVNLDYATVRNENHSGYGAAAKGWLKEQANAVAYKMLATATEYEVDVTSNGLPAAMQQNTTYKVTFAPKGVAGVEVTVNFNVSKDTPPVIEFTKMPLVVPYTEASHMMTQDELKAEMRVTDVPDGNLLAATVAKDAQTGGAPAVDTSNVGVYPITYTVSDSSGNTVSATRAVVVNDGRYVIDEKDDVIIGARNFVIQQEAVTGDESQVRSFSYAEAFDSQGTPIDVTLKGGLPDGYTAKAPDGVYDFEWQADGRTMTKAIKGTVIVADVLYPGDKNAKYALAANNFMRNTTDAALIKTDGDFIAAAGATVIKLTNIAPDGVPRLINSGGFKAEANDYPVQFGITADGKSLPVPPNSVSVTGTVSDGNPPSLTVPTPTEIKVGDSFDAMDGVKAEDDEDGDITSKVKIISGEVKTDTVGIYHLVYEVTDKDHNTVTADRAVVVNDGRYEVGTQRILMATSFVIRLADVPSDDRLLDAQLLSRTGARLYDGATGADLGTSGISVADNGGYGRKAGEYPVELTAADGNSGKDITKDNVLAKVVDQPVIGPINPPQAGDVTYVYGRNLDLTISEAQDILAHSGGKNAGIIEATEAEAVVALAKGDISPIDVKVNADGGFKAEVGTYKVKISDVNNKTEIELTLRVTAGEPPVLKVVPKPIEFALSPGAGSLTKAQLMQGVTATDKEDDAKGKPVQSKITYKIEKAASIPKNEKGSYKVTYSVTDSDGNKAEDSRAVIVNDGSYIFDESYILSAESFVIGKSDVEKEGAEQQILTLSEASAMTAEGDPAAAVVTETGGYTDEVGDYTPTIGVAGYPSLTKRITSKVFDDTEGPGGGNGGNGKYYAITANNFRVSVAEANALAAKTGAAYSSEFILRGMAKVYDRNAQGLNELLGAAIEMTSDGGFKAQAPLTEGKTFKVSFRAADDHTATVTIDVLVSNGGLPVLTVNPAVQKIEIGSSYTEDDYRLGVAAWDPEDGNLTHKVEHTSPVRTDKIAIYRVDYSVQDSNANKATGFRTILVGDWAVIDGYAVRADDFAKMVGEVNGTNEEAISLSKAQAYSLDPAKPSFGKFVDVIVKDSGGYKKEQGSYSLTFAVKEAQSVTFGAIATIGVGGIPVLEVPAVRQIAIDTHFTRGVAMQGVTATDPEDGNLRDKVLYSAPDANTSQAGSFKVDYSVIDSDGNVAVATGLILVGEWKVEGGYAITAHDFQKKLSKIDGTPEEALILAKAKAICIDQDSENYGKEVSVAIANLGGYAKKEGDYRITFAPVVSLGTYVTITASIIDDTPTVIETPPEIKNNEKTVYVENNNNTNTNTRTVTNNNNTVTRTIVVPPVTRETVKQQSGGSNQNDSKTGEDLTVVNPPVDIGDKSTPLVKGDGASADHAGWSLLNLILTFFAFVTMAMLCVAAIRTRRIGEELRKTDKCSLGLSIFAAVAASVLFAVTQAIGGQMSMTDKYTWIFGIATALGIIAVIAAVIADRNREDEELDQGDLE